MKTNIIFDIREPGQPRVALGIYQLRGGYVAQMYVGDVAMPPFTPSAELVAAAA